MLHGEIRAVDLFASPKRFCVDKEGSIDAKDQF